MKHILIAFLIALGLGLIFTSKSQVGEPYIKLNDQEPLLFDSITSIFVKAKVEEISAKHQFVPLYFVFDGKLFFIKSNTDRIDDSMFVGNKFGIIGQSGEVILEQKYDKIYNPNFTITNCLEIAQNGKVGLINLKTNQIIAPQFEYIVPSGNTPSNLAYGLKDNNWLELNSDSMQQNLAPNYSPEKFLSELDMEIVPKTKEIEKFYFSTESFEPLIINSFFGNLLNENKIITTTNEYFKNAENYDFGTESFKVENKLNFNLNLNLNNILYNIIKTTELVVDARYSVSEDYYLIKNNKNKIQTRYFFSEILQYYDRRDFKSLNNNLIQLQSVNNSKYTEDLDSTEKLYEISYYQYPVYNFYKIYEDLEIDFLKSNRYYNFTEYVKLDDSYFKNDYYEFLKKEFRIKNNDTVNYPDEDSLDVNSIIYHHLRIKDLELMKNEILADNGCKFKDKKWSKFFKRFDWYKPKFELIEIKLNEIDKFNLDYIDKRIKEMTGKEKHFTKPEYYYFVAAG